MEERATQKMQQTGETARQEGQKVADRAKQEGQHLADEAKQRLGHVVDETRHQVKNEAEHQMGSAASGLKDAGRQMEQMSQSADGMVATMVGSLGGEVRKLGDRLEQRGLQGTMDDLANYARRNPGTFLLGAAAVGFLAGRVIRNATSDGQQHSGQQRTQYSATRPEYRTAAPPAYPAGTTAGATPSTARTTTEWEER